MGCNVEHPFVHFAVLLLSNHGHGHGHTTYRYRVLGYTGAAPHTPSLLITQRTTGFKVTHNHDIVQYMTAIYTGTLCHHHCILCTRLRVTATRRVTRHFIVSVHCCYRHDVRLELDARHCCFPLVVKRKLYCNLHIILYLCNY